MNAEEVRVYTVLYGFHTALHNRLLNSLWTHLPDKIPIEMYLNTVSEATRQMVSCKARVFDKVRNTNNNAKKYPLMREMFQDLKDGLHPEVKWVLWFDDDAHVNNPEWWKLTTQWIDSKVHENVCYVGQCWFIHWKAGQEQFIKESPWYAGVPVEVVGAKVKRPGIEFAQGSYWWLRKDVLQDLDWPDPRIVHNGGDTMLAEALRQKGLPFHKLPHRCFGVKTNDAPRRGYHEAPAGCKDKNARA